MHPAPAERGDRDHRRVAQEPQHVGDRAPHLLALLRVEQVPLVADDHDGGARGVDALREALVLVGHAFGRVDDEQRGVGAVDRLQRAHEAVVLRRLVDAALAPQARGVDEAQRPVVGLDHRVDRVARRARHVVHDRTVLADEPVEERRLPDVRPPDDRDVEDAVVDRLGFGSGLLVGSARRSLGQARRRARRAARPTAVRGSPRRASARPVRGAGTPRCRPRGVRRRPC